MKMFCQDPKYLTAASPLPNYHCQRMGRRMSLRVLSAFYPLVSTPILESRHAIKQLTFNYELPVRAIAKASTFSAKFLSLVKSLESQQKISEVR